MSRPSHVTFTGVDAQTDLDECVALSEVYPIEWGVLFSKNPKSNRYPDEHVRSRIQQAGLTLAAHVCGKYSKEFQTLDANLLDFLLYSRVQVNSIKYDMEVLTRHSRVFDDNGPTIILQHRHGPFPTGDNFDYLLDRSGGRGVLEMDFTPQTYPYQFCGYAGGLNADNVAEALQRIEARNFWIDMESGVRTNDWLDLKKCRAVCEAIWGKGGA